MIKEISLRPTYLVIHLFSGRRRQNDVHWHLVHMARARGSDLKVLSMDTAVPAHYGDLTEASHSWQRLAQLYEQGLVAARICAPCETFSEARHVPPPEELPDSEKKRWLDHCALSHVYLDWTDFAPANYVNVGRAVPSCRRPWWCASGTCYTEMYSWVSTLLLRKTKPKRPFGQVLSFSCFWNTRTLLYASLTNGSGEPKCASRLDFSAFVCRNWLPPCILARI